MKQAKGFMVKVGWSQRPGEARPTLQPPGVIGETETPLLDVYETPEAIMIEADLPGIDPKAINIQLFDNQITLEGRRCEQGDAETGHYLRMERCYEDFRRILQLPGAVDPTGVEARYDQGVLKLRLPKILDRRRKAIKVEVK